MFYQTKCRLIYDNEVINIFVSVNVFWSLLNVLVSMMSQKSFVLLERQGRLLVPMARSMLLGCRTWGAHHGHIKLLSKKKSVLVCVTCIKMVLPDETNKSVVLTRKLKYISWTNQKVGRLEPSW